MPKIVYKGTKEEILQQFKADEGTLIANLCNRSGDAKEEAFKYAQNWPAEMGYLAVGLLEGQAWNPWTGGLFFHIFKGEATSVSMAEALEKEEQWSYSSADTKRHQKKKK